MGNEIILDGSQGEGGGQILRSSLALSMVTGKPFRIYNIRAGRKKPGLMRQHLTCVRAATKVCSAEVHGSELGSQALTFRPGPMVPGSYFFAVGSAGSSTLVFQTLMPAIMTMGQPFSLTFEGGTHNPAAPSLDFLDRVYLKVLKQMGVHIVLQVFRRGFFPQGGGKWTVTLDGVQELLPLQILERGAFLGQTAKILWKGIPPQEPPRSSEHLVQKWGWNPADIKLEEALDAPGTGNVVMSELQYENITEMLTAFNTAGASPEAICQGLMADVVRYKESAAPVGRRLADQLLLPMALGAGGVFRTMPLSSHGLTNMETIGLFLERPIKIKEVGDRIIEVTVTARS